MLLITAYNPSRVPVSEYDQTPSGGSKLTSVGESPLSEETNEGALPASSVVGEVTEDVPLMEGVYNLRVERRGYLVMYQVDFKIDEFVSFYQE